jgi:hypothetical protein
VLALRACWLISHPLIWPKSGRSCRPTPAPREASVHLLEALWPLVQDTTAPQPAPHLTILRRSNRLPRRPIHGVRPHPLEASPLPLWRLSYSDPAAAGDGVGSVRTSLATVIQVLAGLVPRQGQSAWSSIEDAFRNRPSRGHPRHGATIAQERPGLRPKPSTSSSTCAASLHSRDPQHAVGASTVSIDSGSSA